MSHPLGHFPAQFPSLLGRSHLQRSLAQSPRKGEVPGLTETGPGFAWGRGGLTGTRAKALAALRMRQLGISSGPRHRKAGGLELFALWPERTRVPGTCSLAGWSRHVGQFPRRLCCEAALAAQSASPPTRPGPRSPAGAAVIDLEKGLPSSELPRAFAAWVTMDPKLWGVIQILCRMFAPRASVSPPTE